MKETNFALLGSPVSILASPTGACVHQTGLRIELASVREGHDMADMADILGACRQQWVRSHG